MNAGRERDVQCEPEVTIILGVHSTGLCLQIDKRVEGCGIFNTPSISATALTLYSLRDRTYYNVEQIYRLYFRFISVTGGRWSFFRGDALPELV